jgi:acyl carrier protein
MGNETMRQGIEERLKRLLIVELDVDPQLLTTSDSTTPLLGRGIGLDSFEALVLATGIEAEFAIHIDDAELTVDLFTNLETLADYVLHKTIGQTHVSTEGVTL